MLGQELAEVAHHFLPLEGARFQSRPRGTPPCQQRPLASPPVGPQPRSKSHRQCPAACPPANCQAVLSVLAAAFGLSCEHATRSCAAGRLSPSAASGAPGVGETPARAGRWARGELPVAVGAPGSLGGNHSPAAYALAACESRGAATEALPSWVPGGRVRIDPTARLRQIFSPPQAMGSKKVHEPLR